MVTIANFREENYPEVAGTRCIQIYIPDDDTFKSLLAGLLSLAGVEGNYVQADEAKAAVLAQQWRDAYLQSDWNECEAPVSIPVGAIMQYGTGGSPDGWLLCNGNSYLRADYPALYDAITDFWGTSELGEDYFVVPDFRDKSPFGYHDGGGATKLFGHSYGEENHTLTTAEIPAHNHLSFSANGYALAQAGTGGGAGLGGALGAGTVTGDAGGGSAHNTLHPVAVCGFIIYAGE